MMYNIKYMAWYDLDESGNLRLLIDTDFEYAGEGLPEYEDVMTKYNVGSLDESFYVRDSDSGPDFSLLESYPMT